MQKFRIIFKQREKEQEKRKQQGILGTIDVT